MFDFPLLVTVMALEIEYIIGRYDLLLKNGYVNICPLNFVCKSRKTNIDDRIHICRKCEKDIVDIVTF